ncbi:MAG: Bcr/CflA family drug resistance efflux transporter, partial [Pseudomonadota bacterium]
MSLAEMATFSRGGLREGRGGGSGLATLALVYLDLGETVKGEGTSFRDQLRTYPELFRSPRFWGYVLCAA